MRRLCAIAVAVVFASAGVVLAAGPVERGKFRGKTSKDDPMGLRVDDQNRVRGIFVAGVRMKCPDGKTMTSPTKKDRRVRAPSDYAYPLDASRFYQLSYDSYDPWAIYVQGRFGPKGNKTTGTVQVHVKANSEHRPDPKGKLVCRSPELTFALTRQAPKR